MHVNSDSTTLDHAFGVTHLSRYFSERSPHAIVAVEGATSIVRDVNSAFLRLAGATRESLIGKSFSQAVPEGIANGCNALLERVYETGTYECLEEQKHGDAAPAYWSYAVWAILGKDERTVGLMLQVTDTTEIARFRRQSAAMNEGLILAAIRQHELAEASEALNTQLEAAVREKAHFIAVLSHELRTPLNPVLMAASIFQDDEDLEPHMREIMQMIHRNITLEARLIDDLLDMTRIEHGKVKLERQRLDLRDIVEHAVETSQADLDAAGLTLDMDQADAPQMIEADAGRLQQVFSNLLRNAIKFTPPSGRISIRSHCDDSGCTVEVTDTGLGMEADFVSRAFDAFEQGDKSYARKSGLGLGLAIAKTIIELHGGTISAHSDGKNRGATFTVTLPAVASAPSGI